MRDWFSHTLITRDGTRNLLYQSDAETGGLPNDVVLELERRFLLRGESRSGGRWVELVHDRLVAPIREANEQWRRRHPLVIAADVWNSERRPALLLTGQALADARQELARNPAHYGPIERQLAASSAEAEAELPVPGRHLRDLPRAGSEHEGVGAQAAQAARQAPALPPESA